MIPYVDFGAVLPSVLDVLSPAGVGVVVFGICRGRFVKLYANEPAIRPIGYTVDEWLAKPVWEGIAPEGRDKVPQLYERFATGAPLPPAIAVAVVHPDGPQFPQELVTARAARPLRH